MRKKCGIRFLYWKVRARGRCAPRKRKTGGICVTAFQASRMRDLEQFFILQTAIDRIPDPETRAALEKQKKEISERLETR